MIYTTFPLPSFILVISSGTGIAYSWWPLSRHTEMKARLCDATAGQEGEGGTRTATLHNYAFYISTVLKLHHPLIQSDILGGR